MDSSPGELSVGGLNCRVHLGLIYYLTNQKGKSMKTLAETANSSRDHWRLLTMLLMNEKTRYFTFPRYLENDKTLRDLFEKWHSHAGFWKDPSFLRLYLMHRITNRKLDLTDFLKIDNEICESEASNYIRYRLGLYPKGSNEFTKYSKEKDCKDCSSICAQFLRRLQNVLEDKKMLH